MELILLFTFVIMMSLCWGSFLNVVAYRLAAEKDFFTTRSRCPECDHVISWYDNIPVISWLILGGKCRSCKAPISLLYPFIELLTALIFTAFVYLSHSSYFSHAHINIHTILLGTSTGTSIETLRDCVTSCVYFTFFSALIVATRTDLQALVIPQLVTTWLIPVGVIASYFGLTTISVQDSMIGCMAGYIVLWVIAYLFKRITHKDGLGVGDMELLAMIGSFLGPIGIWFSVMIGSLSGLAIGGFYLVCAGKDRSTRIPFGPFLALGALLFFFFQEQLVRLFIL